MTSTARSAEAYASADEVIEGFELVKHAEHAAGVLDAAKASRRSSGRPGSVAYLFEGIGADDTDQLVRAEADRRGNLLDSFDNPGGLNITRGDLSLTIDGMEVLLAALEHALSMAKRPSTQVDEVIGYIKEKIDAIENPNRALEQELAQLVEERRPPDGEFYKTRVDKNEFAVAFFHRVYGRFYEAGVLYKHQLRSMDFNFYSVLAMTDGSPRLPTKTDFVSRGLQALTTKEAKQIQSLMHAATTRKRRA